MNILNLFKNESIEEVIGINTNISASMFAKIKEWGDMAAGEAPWNEKAPSCGIIDQISDMLNYFVSREIGLKVENKAIAPVMELLNKNVDKLVEYMTIPGGALVRPVYVNNKLQYEALPLGNYLPTRYDFDGTLLGAVILKNIVSNGKAWLLVEEHNYNGALMTHDVKLKLYKNDKGTLKAANLSDCPETEGLTPAYTWTGVNFPMIIEFRNHAVNKIDGSLVPVALIAGAENLIKQADEQWERMNWEQKGGELRVFADRDMFRKTQTRGPDGEKLIQQTVIGKDLNRLLVQVDGDGMNEGGKIHEYAPALRTTAQNDMLQQIFRRIELTINIGKGTISDLESVTQTATQYTGGRQGLYSIVDYLEDEIEEKYKNTALVFAHMAAAYGLGPNDPTIEIIWNDDQTRKDISAAKAQALQEISAGVLDKWEYRVRFYGEDEETARAKVPELDIAPDPFAGA